VRPVNVQFGFWTGPNQNYYADAVPPIAGLLAMLSTKRDLIEASVGTPPAAGSQAAAHRISSAEVHKLLRHLGIR
jgi:hypothetical protein